MKEVELHQRERDSEQETESFLRENIEQFTSDAVFLLGLMIKGERLSAKTVVQKYGKESRRLRDLYESGKCSREWVLKENGKRSHVEYFVIPQKPITKSELIEKTQKAIDQIKTVEDNLITVFSLPDDDPVPPTYKQPSLF